MSLFTNLSSEQIDSINKVTHKKEYFRNEIVFNNQSLVTSICIINRGSILDKSNNKIYKQKEIIGLDLIFSNNPFYKSTYITLESSSVSLIYKEDLYILLKDTSILSNILSMMSNLVCDLSNYNKILKPIESLKRVAIYLYNEYKSTSSLKFYIKYSKDELSKYLNIDNSTLTSNIKYLKENNIILNQNKLYEIISLEKLIYIIN